MLNYLLEVTLCWGVFYLIYALLLSRQTFFVANRWYLIGTLALGLGIPLIEWQAPVIVEQHPIVTTVEPIQITVQQFEQHIIVAQERNHLNWWDVLLTLYWLGVGVFMLRFLHGLWQIWTAYRIGEVVRNGKYRIVYTDTPHLPYSFFNCLFWSKQHDAAFGEQQQILRHEEAHINGWHTLDVLWMELLGILFWCSPMIYLYRISMRNVHEYLADAWVLRTTNKRTYGRLLLSQSLSGFQIALANNFINSQLKKRILMMTRHQSPRHALARYMWLLPIVMLAFLIFSKKENREILRAQFENFTEESYKEIYNRLDNKYELENESIQKLHFEYTKIIEEKPKVAHETAIIIGQIAAKQGLIFTLTQGDFGYGNFTMNFDDDLHEGRKSPVDRLPRFMECSRFGTSDLAKDICADSRMHEFIYRHLEYPEATKQYGYKGEVYVRMRIEADGSTSKITTEHLRDVDEHCEREALRIAEKMRMNWLPAERNGQPVAWDIIVPFIFSPEGVPTIYAPDLVNTMEAHEHTRDTLLAQFEMSNGGEILNIHVTRNSKENFSDEEFVELIKQQPREAGFGNGLFNMSPMVAKLIYSTNDKTIIYYNEGNHALFLQQLARFPGCKEITDNELAQACADQQKRNFIAAHINYPEAAIQSGFQGDIMTRFSVKTDGTIADIDILSSPNGGIFEEEIKRIFSLMPKWIPAERNGQKVESRVTQAFHFDLSDEGAIAYTPELISNFKPYKVGDVPDFPTCKNCNITFLKSDEQAGMNIYEIIYKARLGQEPAGKAIKGYGIIDFVIEETGYLSEISIVQRVNPDFDKGMIDAVKNIASWSMGPGSEQRSRVRCHVPVFDDIENINFEHTPLANELELQNLTIQAVENKIRLQFQAATTPISIRLSDQIGRDVYDRKLMSFDGTFDEIIHNSTEEGQIYFLRILQDGKMLVRHINLATKKLLFSTIPIPEGTDYKITSTFGMRMHPVHKIRKMHKGVDFKADLGSPIIVTEDGEVLMTKADKVGYGKHIIIEHADGFRSMYAHLDEIKVQAGQAVKRGELIGTVGETGHAIAPHLHYEILKDGKKLDPMDYIKR